jgi:hypothetical protein
VRLAQALAPFSKPAHSAREEIGPFQAFLTENFPIGANFPRVDIFLMGHGWTLQTFAMFNNRGPAEFKER